MKEVFFDVNNKIVVQEVPAPRCEDNGILVEVKYSLISTGTEAKMLSVDQSSFKQKVGKKIELGRKGLTKVRSEGIRKTIDAAINRTLKIEPTGYSAAGIVIERGKRVSDISKGDLVACAGVGFANHAEVIYVPRNLAAKVPQNVTLEQAAFTTLGSIALQAVRQARLQIGETAVVLGLGLIGLIVVQILNAAGCRVVGIDLDQEKVELGKQLGLLKGLVSPETQMIEEVQKITEGHGADAVVICAAARHAGPVINSIELVRKKGRVVVVGTVDMTIPRNPFYQKEVEFTISHSYGPGRNDIQYEEYGVDYPYHYVRWTENRNMQEFLKMISDKKVNVNKLISLKYPIEQAEIAYESLIKVRPKPTAVMLTYDNNDIEEKSKRKFELRPQKSLKDNINVALIGCGNFGKEVHLPNIRKIPGYNLRALVSRTGSNAIQTAKMFNAGYASTDYKEILRDKDIDMVLITTRHNLHAKMALEAAKAGKDVFVEKPMALTYDECKELSNAIRENNINFTVGYNRRFSPLAYESKRLLNDIKSPMLINYRVNALMAPKNHWTQDPGIGGGRIIGEVCHFFDFINYILNDDVTTVYAEHIPPDNQSVFNLDSFIATLKYQNGSLLVLTYTSLGNKNLDKELIEIFVDGRTIVINDFKSLELYGFKEKGMRLPNQDKGLMNELIEFKKKIMGEESSSVTLDDSIKATVLTFKILESLKENRIMKINWEEYL